jgi:hypothetical protein
MPPTNIPHPEERSEARLGMRTFLHATHKHPSS